MRIPLADLNRLDRAAFVARLGRVYEHSPWVAERAWLERPFDSLPGLRAAMQQTVEHASRDEQLALIRAHPELAGKLAIAGQLTDESRAEQASAGLDRCTPEEFAEFQALNGAYRSKFDFPFIVAVRGLSRSEILARLTQRMSHSAEQELSVCLREIGRIARFRLDDLIEEHDVSSNDRSASHDDPQKILR
jgi:2-oxo-4-hydroxy-4-carboxy-5-ureidoimidazoline decarboxylase